VVALSSNTPHPLDPTKFFGCELGAQCTFDEKADKYIVNGAHSQDRLRELLDVFIEKFVLCASCKNPETDLILTKTEDIYRDCKACGQRTGVDMRHKLTTFIIRNPPKVAKGKKSKGAHATADATGGTNGANNGSGSPGGGSGNASEDDELTKRIKAEAAELPTVDQAAAHGEDWSLDTSPEAVKARRSKTLENALSTLVIDPGEESEGEGADSPYAIIRGWAEENRDTASAVDVYKKAQELGIEKKHKTVQFLVLGLFTTDIVKEIPKYSALFKKVGIQSIYPRWM
jgi:translation initiation factor 5